jgi:hypothetical protein
LGGLRSDLVKLMAGASHAMSEDVSAGGLERHHRGVVQLLAVAGHYSDDSKWHVINLDRLAECRVVAPE